MHRDYTLPWLQRSLVGELHMGTVTGPFKTTHTWYYPDGTAKSLVVQEKYKQGHPFEDKPLPYGLRVVRTSAQYNSDVEKQLGCYSYIEPNDTSWVRYRAQNMCYERFVNKIHETAELGLFAAERREAADLILQRVLTLRKGWLALRLGRFKEFLRLMRVQTPLKKHRGMVRNRSKQASALWLEYWFGWSPMLSDIYTAVELIDSPYPDYKVFATARARDPGAPERVNPWGGTYNELREHEFSFRMQADVSISNPMLYRASQFGIVNPATILWELVPFSFLVDWFIPVGNYLSSYSDFVGLEPRNAFTTERVTSKNYCDALVANNPRRTTRFIGESFRLTRTLGIPRPVVVPSEFKGLSVTRGATAISLLIALFVK